MRILRDLGPLDYSTSLTGITVTYTNPAGTTAGGNTIRNVEAVAVSGSSANDVITVTATSGGPFNSDGNLILAGAGNDVVRSGSGKDLLIGGDGNDNLNGGNGDDNGFVNYTTVTGATAAAQIAGLFGGAGNDTLNGGAGSDLLEGGTGADRLTGGLMNTCGDDRVLASSPTVSGRLSILEAPLCWARQENHG